MALDEWLRWESGEKKEVLIQSDKSEKRLVHWTGEMYEDCEGKGCVWCREKVKRVARYAVEALAGDDVWTWEMAGLVWKQLKDVAEEYGGLRGLRLKVKRTGEYLKTRYTLIPLGQASMPDEEQTLWDRGAVARDPRGAAVFVKELAASLELTAKEAMSQLLAEASEGMNGAGNLDKLVGLIKWLNWQVLEARQEAEETQEIDLDDLLT